jgi:hypothetical protein
VKDTDLKESLMNSVIEKTKKMLIENGYPENANVTFAVEDAEEKGNYTVRIFKPKVSDPNAKPSDKESKPKEKYSSKSKTAGASASKVSDPGSGPKTASGGGGGKPTYATKAKVSKTPSEEVLDVLITAIEAVAIDKKIELTSQGQKTAMAIKLSGMVDGLFASM